VSGKAHGGYFICLGFPTGGTHSTVLILPKNHSSLFLLPTSTPRSKILKVGRKHLPCFYQQGSYPRLYKNRYL
jgi:hypothetical protein